MNKKLSLFLLLSGLASSRAMSYSSDILHPKLISYHLCPFDEIQENQLCAILVEVSDLSEFKKLSRIEIISEELCAENKWQVHAFLKKIQLVAILDLPSVLSVKLLKD